jgi:hypothetical protein
MLLGVVGAGGEAVTTLGDVGVVIVTTGDDVEVSGLLNRSLSLWTVRQCSTKACKDNWNKCCR